MGLLEALHLSQWLCFLILVYDLTGDWTGTENPPLNRPGGVPAGRDALVHVVANMNHAIVEVDHHARHIGVTP